MIDLTRRWTIAGGSLLILALLACSRAPEGWTPVLEETSTTFLRTETEAIASNVRLARANLQVKPQKATKELAAAQDKLDHLLTYYLPLLKAREDAYNAYRYHYLHDTRQTARKLDDVEAILMTVAKSGHGHWLRKMEEPLEKLEDARAALEADSDEATGALKALAIRLDSLLVKGGLVLAE